MTMLRDFSYKPEPELIRTVLKQFSVEIPETFTLLHFELLSPDSFMWRLRIGKSIYYLYAEDFVSDMDEIRANFGKLIGNNTWELVPAKTVRAFHDTSPVKGETVYKEPENVTEMMQYAVESGHDFVFLARSHEKIEDAYFSRSSPHEYKF